MKTENDITEEKTDITEPGTEPESYPAEDNVDAPVFVPDDEPFTGQEFIPDEKPDRFHEEYLLGQIKSGRIWLLVFICLTVINCLTTIFTDTSAGVFTSSAAIISTTHGVYISEAYNIPALLPIGIGVAAAIVLLFTLCLLFSKRQPVFLLFALILMSVDTCFTLYWALTDFVILDALELSYHAVMIIMLSSAVHAARQLKQHSREYNI